MLKLLPVALGVVLVLAPLSARSATVEVGIDVLASKDFDLLKGKRVAVVTNHTGLNAAGTHLVPLLIENKVQLVKLFSPEHGLYGLKDEHVGDGIDEKTGLPVFSLYGGKDKRKPNADQLNGVDVLVFDIQDIGTRFYTYISTMGLCMEACAENKVKFVVLDRPNPINGTRVDGAINDEKHSGFTAYRKLPLVHGMTVGELAQLFNEEFDIHCDLTVVPMTGWKRSMYWEETGVKWVNPSPNMRSVTQAILYPAIGQLESSNLSVGRGTETPFELELARHRLRGGAALHPAEHAARVQQQASQRRGDQAHRPRRVQARPHRHGDGVDAPQPLPRAMGVAEGAFNDAER
jgi:uncharacterized protein YbbC (DUF1343 family)